MQHGVSVVSPETFREFTLVILPGSYGPSFAFRDYYEASYRYYREVWHRIMTRLTGPDSYNGEDFFKQHFVTTLFHKGRVVAQLASRYLHLSDGVTNDLEYFGNFRTGAAELLKEKGAEHLFTLEWNSVNAEYSRRKSGFHFVDLMLRFNAMMGFHMGCHACTAVPRKVTGVQNVLTEIGFRTIEEGLVKYRSPIDIMIGLADEITKPKEPGLAEFMSYLWQNRIDATGLVKAPGQTIIKPHLPGAQTEGVLEV